MLKSSKDTHRRTQFFVGEWGRRIEVLQLYISQFNPIRLVTVINICSPEGIYKTLQEREDAQRGVIIPIEPC